MNYRKKSLKKNLILTTIKTIASCLFPLITFPYVTRVLSPAGIGEYNYANSIVGYFSLIAALGIGKYSIREGAKLRDNQKKIEEFSSEIFSLNMFFTVFAYLLLGLCFIFFQEFKDYSIAIFIWSSSILFETIGINWIFSIYEDYSYITIRSLIIQFVSLICLFIFVRTEDDIYWYIAINVFANVGSNIFSFFYGRRYCHVKIVFTPKMWNHFIPVFIIFSTALSTKIYVTLDTTMIGWICDTNEVGYYTVSCKMYNILKTVINSFVPVFMARLSYQYANDKDKYVDTFKYGYELITLFTIPLAIGSVLFSKEVIILLSSEEYLQAEPGMKLLFFSMIFATLGNLYSSGGLLQAGKERLMLLATSIGAGFNFLMNLICIPKWRSTGAAFTTLITEILIFTILYICYKKYIRVKVGISHIIKCIFASLSFILIKYLGVVLDLSNIGYQIILICICIVSYFIILFILKDNIVKEIFTLMKSKIIYRKKDGN